MTSSELRELPFADYFEMSNALMRERRWEATAAWTDGIAARAQAENKKIKKKLGSLT